MAESFWKIASRHRRRAFVVFAIFTILYFLFLWVLLIGVYLLLRLYGFSFGELPVLQGSALTAFGIGSLLVAAQYRFARRHALPHILEMLRAHPPDPTDSYHVRFRNVVEEMRLAAGVPVQIQPVISSLVSVNAFAATDQLHGAVVGVTEGLLGKLDREQLQCVVAHEIAHLRSGDATLTTLICSMIVPFVTLYEKARASRENLQNTRSRAGGSIGLGEAYLFLVVFILRLLATLVERRRELRADAEAVELTRNPVALAEAIWVVTRENHFVCDDMIGNAYAPIFIADPTAGPDGGRDGFLAELFTTHPPLGRRLAPLLEMAGINMPELLDRLEHKTSLRQKVYGAVKEDLPTDLIQEPLGGELNAQVGSCPECGIPLAPDRWAGVLIASCPHCHGRLVEDAKMVRVLTRATWRANTISPEEAEAFFRKNYLRSKSPEFSDPRPKHVCPLCKLTMTRNYFSYQFNIIVDRCFACDVTWFDANELEMLYQLQHVIHE